MRKSSSRTVTSVVIKPMIGKLVTKVIGSRNQRVLRQYGKVVQLIGQLEAQMEELSDEELTAKTSEYKPYILPCVLSLPTIMIH